MNNLRIISPKKLNKTKILIPGSKSYTNRALLLAALSTKGVKIINPLISEDTIVMINCLKKLGIKIIQKKNLIEVKNNISSTKNKSFNLDVQISGTTMRFILALSTVVPGIKIIGGKEALNKRPIKDLVDVLSQLGAKIEYMQKKGFPPVKVISSSLESGEVKIAGTLSSQYLSALLMVAPLVGEVKINVKGEQVSKPYVDMTIDIMKQFGVTVENKQYKKYFILSNQSFKVDKYIVEGDYSSAAYFFAIAALLKTNLTIGNLNPNSKQADKGFLEILEKMGNKVIFGKDQVTIEGKGVRPIKINMQDCPDQIQTLAVLASFAKGKTVISGISTLRIKETDRLFALTEELKKMRIKTSVSGDTLIIFGGDPKAAKIETYGDHRMAMAFTVAGVRLEGLEIVNAEVVSKTFPNFWKELNSIGIKTENFNPNIVLIGMRGSGKTTIAKLLAKKLKKQYLELDEILVKKLGMSIPKIVQEHGWEFFRKKESEIVNEISDKTGMIISTGGGVVTKDENIKALKKNGKFIFLNTPLEMLVKRLKKSKNRPPLTNRANLEDEIKELLKKRKRIYDSSADLIINTEKLTPERIAENIISYSQGGL